MLLISGAIVAVVLAVNGPFVTWWVGESRFGGTALTALLLGGMLVRHLNATLRLHPVLLRLRTPPGADLRRRRSVGAPGHAAARACPRPVRRGARIDRLDRVYQPAAEPAGAGTRGRRFAGGVPDTARAVADEVHPARLWSRRAPVRVDSVRSSEIRAVCGRRWRRVCRGDAARAQVAAARPDADRPSAALAVSGSEVRTASLEPADALAR